MTCPSCSPLAACKCVRGVADVEANSTATAPPIRASDPRGRPAFCDSAGEATAQDDRKARAKPIRECEAISGRDFCDTGPLDLTR